VHIVCATGLYKEDEGAAAYFKFRQHWGDALGEMTDLFVRELTDGVGDTGIRAASLRSAPASAASRRTRRRCSAPPARRTRRRGRRSTTHTDQGTMGPAQLDVLQSEGVDPRAVVVGHSCGQSDVHYHLDMLDRGATLGFDRFGLEILHPDASGSPVLIGLLGIGFERQLVLSHDTVWCWRGRAPKLPPICCRSGSRRTSSRRSCEAQGGRRVASEDRDDARREPAPVFRRRRLSASARAGVEVGAWRGRVVSASLARDASDGGEHRDGTSCGLRRSDDAASPRNVAARDRSNARQA